MYIMCIYIYINMHLGILTLANPEGLPVCLYTQMCIHICMHVYMYIYKHMHHMYMYIYTCIALQNDCRYIYIYIHIYIYPPDLRHKAKTDRPRGPPGIRGVLKFSSCKTVQGGEDPYDALSSQDIFRKRAL